MNTAGRLSSAFDVVSIGESLAALAPDPPALLRDGPSMRLGVGGAESSVATYLALLGMRSAWIGRVGADPFGELVRRQLASVGADTSLMEVDDAAPTGLYVKDPDRHKTAVYYYRERSAASFMNRGTLERLPRTAIVHLSGITAALSDSCLDMMVHALMDRPVADAVMSFDINYRPQLWPVDTAASVLNALAGAADLVFVALDEAETLWGTPTADDVRVKLPTPERLVVKNGGVGATLYEGTGDGVFVEAPVVRVTDSVGAGDAFAAGYLYGMLKRADERARLRLGHLLAGGVLQTSADIGMLPGMPHIEHALRGG